jgi:hypothetical protein
VAWKSKRVTKRRRARWSCSSTVAWRRDSVGLLSSERNEGDSPLLLGYTLLPVTVLFLQVSCIGFNCQTLKSRASWHFTLCFVYSQLEDMSRHTTGSLVDHLLSAASRGKDQEVRRLLNQGAPFGRDWVGGASVCCTNWIHSAVGNCTASCVRRFVYARWRHVLNDIWLFVGFALVGPESAASCCRWRSHWRDKNSHCWRLWSEYQRPGIVSHVMGTVSALFPCLYTKSEVLFVVFVVRSAVLLYTERL